MNSQGQTITLQPGPLKNNYDLSHSHSSFLAMYDHGKMDGADKVTLTCNKGAVGCPPPNPQFMYVDPSDVDPYFQMAEQSTFRGSHVSDKPGTELPGASIHYFRDLCAHC